MSKNLTITFEEYQAQKLILDAAVDASSKALQVFPSGAGGLTPDDIKLSPEFQAAKREFAIAFDAIRKFNATIPKAFMQRASVIRRAARTQP